MLIEANQDFNTLFAVRDFLKGETEIRRKSN